MEDRTPGDYDVSQCVACQLVYLSRRPDDASLPSCYPQDYLTRLNRTANPILRVLFRILHHVRMRNLRRWRTQEMDSLLEIGCGDGRLLSFLETKWGNGYRIAGVDFVVDRKQLAPGSKIDLIPGEIDKIDTIDFNRDPAHCDAGGGFRDRFDMVIAYNVLEHLPRPVKTLRHLQCNVMKNGGVFIGQVPDWNSPWRRIFPRHWNGLHVPRHLIFFDRKSLQKTLEAAGLRVERIDNVFEPGEFSVSTSNWITDTLKLKTRPRQAWFSLPLMLIGAPFVISTVALGLPCALGFVARRE